MISQIRKKIESSDAAQVAVGDQRPPEEQQVINRLIDGKVLWTGTFKGDWWFYQCNNHPVVGVFMAHRFHPFSKGERAVVILCMLFASFLVGVGAEAIRHQDCSAHAGYSLYTEEDCRADAESSATLFGIFMGIVVSLWAMWLKFISTCACVQKTKLTKVRDAAETCGRCGLVAGFVLSLIMLIVGSVIVSGSDDMDSQVVVSFITAQMTSFGYSFFFGTLLFLYKRHKEMKELEEQEKAAANNPYADKEEVNVTVTDPPAAVPMQPSYAQPQPEVQMQQQQQQPQPNYAQQPVQPVQPMQPDYAQQPMQPVQPAQPSYAQPPVPPMPVAQPAQPSYEQPSVPKPAARKPSVPKPVARKPSVPKPAARRGPASARKPVVGRFRKPAQPAPAAANPYAQAASQYQ